MDYCHLAAGRRYYSRIAVAVSDLLGILRCKCVQVSPGIPCAWSELLHRNVVPSEEARTRQT